MKTTDILSELENVKEKYKTDAQEENAGKYFNKNRGRKILKFVLSGAALFVFAAFITLTVMTKYASKPDHMVSREAGVGFDISGTALTQETFKPDSSKETTIELLTDNCIIQGGQTQSTDRSDPDYFMNGGIFAYKLCPEYDTDTSGDKSYFVKSENGKESWRYEINGEMYLQLLYRVLDNGVLLIENGNIFDTEIENTTATTRLTMLDNDGNRLWVSSFKNPVGSPAERFAGVFEDSGKIYVASYKSDVPYIPDGEGGQIIKDVICSSLIVTEYSEQTGKQLDRRETPVRLQTDYCKVNCIGLTEYGCVFSYVDYDYKTNLVLVKNDGNIERITGFGENYEFCSASSVGGKIYLSGKRMTPKVNLYSDVYYSLSESAHVYNRFTGDYFFSYVMRQFKENAALTEKYKKETAAVLLVCDKTLSPEYVYTQDAAYGGVLKATDSGLLWDVVQLCSVYSSTSSDATPVLIGLSRTYTFDGTGLLTSFDDTAYKYIMTGCIG